MTEVKKAWIIGKRKIDGIAPGVPIEVDEHVAKRFIDDGVAEGISPPEVSVEPVKTPATGNKPAPPKDEKPAK